MPLLTPPVSVGPPAVGPAHEHLPAFSIGDLAQRLDHSDLAVGLQTLEGSIGHAVALSPVKSKMLERIGCRREVDTAPRGVGEGAATAADRTLDVGIDVDI